MDIREKPIQILCVENDEDDYVFLKKMLDKLTFINCKLDWEKTYEAGNERIKAGEHDIYIVDYGLGEHNGLELIQEAHQSGFDRPVILLTGMGEEGLGIKALRAGAEDYLIKADLAPAILERSIRYALERKEASQRRQALVVEQAARRVLEQQKDNLEKLVKQIKASEQEIKEREKHYSNIVSTLAEGVMIHNADGTIETANHSALKILGLTLDQLRGKVPYHSEWKTIRENGTEFLPEEHPSILVSKTGISQINVVMGVHRSDGKLVWILVHSIPLYKEYESKPYNIVTSFIDITKRKNLEQHKDQFIGTASHELKTPVTSLKLFAELLHDHAKKISEKTVVEYSEIIVGQANRLVSLLNDLLDVSRIDAGRLELKPKVFDLNDLIRDIIREYKHTRKTKHEIKHISSVKKRVCADSDRISQVMINLISNAIKYSPQADHIIIETKEKGKKAEISVKDFGFGISAEEQKKIFERFFRTKDAQQKNIAGFGLGLHISQEIVRRHGGEIKIESKIGEGSVFLFDLELRD